MSSDESQAIYTTNAEDQAEAAKLQERLSNSTRNDTSNAAKAASPVTPSPAPPAWLDLPSVSIDAGSHKYVLISAMEPAPRSTTPDEETSCKQRYFVVSKRGAHYHRIVAAPFVDMLEGHGFHNVRIKGGGRISLDHDTKRVFIFGYSYGFGRADHAQAKAVVDADHRFSGYNVTWSNDGY